MSLRYSSYLVGLECSDLSIRISTAEALHQYLVSLQSSSSPKNREDDLKPLFSSIILVINATSQSQSITLHQALLSSLQILLKSSSTISLYTAIPYSITSLLSLLPIYSRTTDFIIISAIVSILLVLTSSKRACTIIRLNKGLHLLLSLINNKTSHQLLRDILDTSANLVKVSVSIQQSNSHLSSLILLFKHHLHQPKILHSWTNLLIPLCSQRIVCVKLLHLGILPILTSAVMTTNIEYPSTLLHQFLKLLYPLILHSSYQLFSSISVSLLHHIPLLRQQLPGSTNKSLNDLLWLIARIMWMKNKSDQKQIFGFDKVKRILLANGEETSNEKYYSTFNDLSMSTDTNMIETTSQLINMNIVDLTDLLTDEIERVISNLNCDGTIIYDRDISTNKAGTRSEKAIDDMVQSPITDNSTSSTDLFDKSLLDSGDSPNSATYLLNSINTVEEKSQVSARRYQYHSSSLDLTLSSHNRRENELIEFDSHFESGNLHRVIAHTSTHYSLLLSSDTNTVRHTQWFFFSMQYAFSSIKTSVRLDIINCDKDGSSFTSGMLPVCYSTKRGNGWRRCDFIKKVLYYKNIYEKKRTKTSVLITKEIGQDDINANKMGVSVLSNTNSNSEGEEEEDEEKQSMKRTKKLSKSSPVKRSSTSLSSSIAKPGKLSLSKKVERKVYRSKESSKEIEKQCYYTLSLTLELPFDRDICYLSYCYPFTYSYLCKTLASYTLSPYSSQYIESTILHTTSLGKVEMLTISDRNASLTPVGSRPIIFITGRIHPGESNSSWVMKGILELLLSSDPVAKYIRSNLCVKTVPMLNVDGVIVGNTRTALEGIDLNRSWIKPQNEVIRKCKNLVESIFSTSNRENLSDDDDGSNRSNEIMLYLDLHGHSRMKNVCLYGCEEATDIILDREKSKVATTHSTAGSQSSVTSSAASPLSSPPLSPHLSSPLSSSSSHLFPSFLAQELPDRFSPSLCSFTIPHSKRGTARVVLWRSLELSECYTVESSFAGGGKSGRKQFCPFDWEEIGRGIVRSIQLLHIKIDRRRKEEKQIKLNHKSSEEATDLSLDNDEPDEQAVLEQEKELNLSNRLFPLKSPNLQLTRVGEFSLLESSTHIVPSQIFPSSFTDNDFVFPSLHRGALSDVSTPLFKTREAPATQNQTIDLSSSLSSLTLTTSLSPSPSPPAAMSQITTVQPTITPTSATLSAAPLDQRSVSIRPSTPIPLSSASFNYPDLHRYITSSFHQTKIIKPLRRHSSTTPFSQRITSQTFSSAIKSSSVPLLSTGLLTPIGIEKKDSLTSNFLFPLLSPSIGLGGSSGGVSLLMKKIKRNRNETNKGITNKLEDTEQIQLSAWRKTFFVQRGRTNLLPKSLVELMNEHKSMTQKL